MMENTMERNSGNTSKNMLCDNTERTNGLNGGLHLGKKSASTPTVEQLTISMFVYTCACRCFNSDNSKGARGIFSQV